MKKIIDVCCGAKHFWFNKENPLVEFCDKRYAEDIELCNGQHISIKPSTICDFKNLPFEDNTYSLVVFDPPHLIDKTETAWLVKKYGTLPKEWREELKRGFLECWRVLKPNGTLIFKWNETEVPTSEIIKLFGIKPILGHKSGKRMNTNWLVYFKAEEVRENEAVPIEWIENWKRGKTSIEQVVADKIMMDYKYRDYWEKENETNRR